MAVFSTDFVFAPRFTHRLQGPTTAFCSFSGEVAKGMELTAPDYRPWLTKEFQRSVAIHEYSKSLELLRDLVGKGYTPREGLCGRLITGLLKRRKFSKADEVIRIMEEYGNPGVWAYSRLIEGYVRTKKISEAQGAFGRMVKRGVSPDAFSYSLMIEGLARRGDFDRAMGFYEEMLLNGSKPNAVTFGCLVEGAILQGGLENGMKLLDGVQPNEAVYRAMAIGLCRQGNPDIGLEFFRKIEDLGCLMTADHYDPIISVLWNHGNQARALRLTLEMLDKGIDPGIFTYRTLISCLCKDRLFDEAIQLLADMDETRLGPDAMSYHTVINALCRRNRVDDAIELLFTMVEKGCWPVNETFDKLIKAVSLSVLESEAMDLLNSLRSMKALTNDRLGQEQKNASSKMTTKREAFA